MVEVDVIYVRVTEKYIDCKVCVREIDNLLLASEPAYPSSVLNVKLL
jgi:hypothetical protein